MLAMGTIDSLASQYGAYEVRFTCRTRSEALTARSVMSKIPGSKAAEDVATRFIVPVTSTSAGAGITLSQLFRVLSRESALEYTVEKASLESVFLNVVKQSQPREERAGYPKGRRQLILS